VAPQIPTPTIANIHKVNLIGFITHPPFFGPVIKSTFSADHPAIARYLAAWFLKNRELGQVCDAPASASG
jgi:hypothetical protein